MNKKDFIEVPFGAKDSELIKFEYTIPEGYEAIIENGKVIVKKMESEDEMVRKELESIIMKCDSEVYYKITKTPKVEILAWLEKQCDKDNYPNLPKFTFDDVLALQCCMETVKKVQEDKTLYEQLQSLHNRVHDAYHLEKQGEQKSINDTDEEIVKAAKDTSILDMIGPKFKFGDWVACEGLNTAHIISIQDDRYEVEFIDGNKGFPHINYIDRNFHLWTIQDAKDGDVLACENGWTCIFNCLNDNLFTSYCFMDNEGWFCEDGGQAHTLDKRICGEIHPATKEQRDILFQKMKEAGYEWDAENKELKKIEQKSAWHREDEQNLNDALGYIDDEYLRRWLKDVIYNKYEKHAWSEEDDKMLIDAIGAVGAADYYTYDDKQEIEQWLKSLKARFK